MSENKSLLILPAESSTETSTQRVSQPIEQKWINAIFSDDVDRMKELLTLLNDEKNEHSVQEITKALEELEDLVESIDNANDLVKINGLHVILPLLRSTESTIRSGTASVISTCLQNNLNFQKSLIEINGFQILVELFKNDTDETVQLKTLGAISAIIKQNKAAEKIFAESDGFQALVATLTRPDISPRISKKVIFLFSNLMAINANYRNILRDYEFILAIKQYLSTVDLADAHMVLHSLSEFIKDKKNAELAISTEILPILAELKQKCFGNEDYNDTVQQITSIQENLANLK